MSVPIVQHHRESQLAEFVERHDTLRMVMEWIADRFADAPEIDTSIDWEDGEEHDETEGSSSL